MTKYFVILTMQKTYGNTVLTKHTANIVTPKPGETRADLFLNAQEESAMEEVRDGVVLFFSAEALELPS